MRLDERVEHRVLLGAGHRERAQHPRAELAQVAVEAKPGERMSVLVHERGPCEVAAIAILDVRAEHHDTALNVEARRSARRGARDGTWHHDDPDRTQEITYLRRETRERFLAQRDDVERDRLVETRARVARRVPGCGIERDEEERRDDDRSREHRARGYKTHARRSKRAGACSLRGREFSLDHS